MPVWRHVADMSDDTTLSPQNCQHRHPTNPTKVGECGQTKVSKAKGTKKVPWHWDKVHQEAFDHVNATIAKEVVLAYPDFQKSLRFT